MAVQSWYENLTDVRGLAPNTAVRHFHVMRHMMEKASTIWSKLTGIDRNPADQVESNRLTIHESATYRRKSFSD